MKIQLIRNATMKFEYAGQTFLTDPYLAPRFSRPSFTGRSKNPLVELPISTAEILAGVEWILLSHLHSDHFDPEAERIVPKSLPIFCQSSDLDILSGKGFSQVIGIEGSFENKGIRIERIPCQHGSGSVLDEMGDASGFLLNAADEPSVFWMGDTILTDGLRELVHNRQPDIIITHSNAAVWGKGTLIVMDAAQTIEVCQLAPKSKLIAIHMDALDHGTQNRQDLRDYANNHSISEQQLLIPKDGNTLQF